MDKNKDHKYWDKSYNPVTGCGPSSFSESCCNCWAAAMVKRFPELHGTEDYYSWRPYTSGRPTPFSIIKFHPERLAAPLHWKKPRRVFVCDLGDFFHNEVQRERKEAVYKVVDQCPQHQFFFLTKRPENVGAFWTKAKNAMLGVTVESDKYLHRIETLLQIPAAARWISFEPLLSAIDLNQNLNNGKFFGDMLQFAVVGAESRPGRRPMKIEWAIDLVEQLRYAGIKVWVKQIDLNGKVEHDITKFPKELQFREFLEVQNG